MRRRGLLWLLGLLAACAGSPPEAPSPVHRAVLVVIDALPADVLGAYGSSAGLTPSLDAFASQAVVFDRFHSASPWTLPSFASILSGVSPWAHQAGEKLQRGEQRRDAFGIRSIHPALPLLPELLGDVPTAMVVTNAFLDPVYGMERGFDHYDQVPAGFGGYRRAAEAVDEALAWMEQQEGSFFLLLHLFDPHMPYDPPASFRQRADGLPPGRIDFNYAQFKQLRDGDLQPTEEEKRYIRAMYEGEVAYTDHELGRLMARMQGMGLLEDTWLAVTADHGEEHYQHGGFEHGHRYEEEVTHVPLLIHLPAARWAGSRVAPSTRHIDLLPTVLDWFQVDPPGHLEGASLSPLLGAQGADDRLAYMENNLVVAESVALYDGRYKLVRRVDGSDAFLYDLLQDPHERDKLREGAEFQRMMSLLDAYRSRLDISRRGLPSGATEALVPPEVRQALRSLGYLQ